MLTLPPPAPSLDPVLNLVTAVHHPHDHSMFTRLNRGCTVHPLRASLAHALHLLRENDPACHRQAACMLEAVTSYQVTDTGSPNFGIWPWMIEEPVGTLPVTDTNTACFFGVQYAIALVHHADRLPATTRHICREALRRAAEGIAQRPIRPEYTNIALLGAAATAPAGEILERPDLIAHARERLDAVAESVKTHGGFAEYNSPAYTPVAIEALEMILYTTRDAEFRKVAHALLDTGWQVVAEHYHAGTRQWAGPYSRTYSDIQENRFIRQRCPVPAALDDAPAWALPVPPAWAERFRTPPRESATIRRLFINRDPPGTSAVGTTWMDATACLGSVTLDNTTYQRRPLLGYWHVPGVATPAVLRLRVLRDGHDFASAVLRCAQDGPRVLAAVGFAGNLGDVQHVADRPLQPVFSTKRLIVRIELHAEAVLATQHGACLFELAAGAHRAWVHGLPAVVFGQAAQWRCGQEAHLAFVEAVLVDASVPVTLDLRTATETVGLALELLPAAAPSTPPTRETDGFRWDAHNLQLDAHAFRDYPQ